MSIIKAVRGLFGSDDRRVVLARPNAELGADVNRRMFLAGIGAVAIEPYVRQRSYSFVWDNDDSRMIKILIEKQQLMAEILNESQQQYQQMIQSMAAQTVQVMAGYIWAGRNVL